MLIVRKEARPMEVYAIVDIKNNTIESETMSHGGAELIMRNIDSDVSRIYTYNTKEQAQEKINKSLEAQAKNENCCLYYYDYETKASNLRVVKLVVEVC